MAIDRLLARRRAAGMVALVLLLSLYARQAFDLHRRFVEAPSRFFAYRVDELSRYLVQSPIRFAYAEYGEAMITTFLTRERVVVTDYQNRRYPIDEENVDNPAVILFDDPAGSGADVAQLGHEVREHTSGWVPDLLADPLRRCGASAARTRELEDLDHRGRRRRGADARRGSADAVVCGSR